MFMARILAGVRHISGVLLNLMNMSEDQFLNAIMPRGQHQQVLTLSARLDE